MQAGIECLFVIGTAPLQHRMGVNSSWPGPLWTGGVSAGMKLFLEFKIFLLAVIQFHVTLSTLCTRISISTFSILFFVLFLWHWQGEFVYQSMLYLSLYISFACGEGFIKTPEKFLLCVTSFFIRCFFIIIIIIIIIDNQPDFCCRLRKFSPKWDN